MLKVLNRDNQLRRMCVQRRWQGLQCDRSDTYDRDGAAQRIVGANIDVTERKKPELTLAERTLQLALERQSPTVTATPLHQRIPFAISLVKQQSATSPRRFSPCRRCDDKLRSDRHARSNRVRDEAPRLDSFHGLAP